MRFSGTVDSWLGTFGYIKPKIGGKNIFVHKEVVKKAGLKTLRIGQVVTFEIGNDNEGRPQAINLMVS